jgi:hypothetical protein
MSASFPNQLKAFTVKRNNIDIYDASHMNDVQNEITAIEAYLGVSGNANLSSIEWKLGDITTGDRAVPTTASGQRLYRKTLVRPRIFPETQPNPPTLGNLYVDSSTRQLYYGNGVSWVPAGSGVGTNAPIGLTPAAGGTATLDLSLSRKFRIAMPVGNITIAVTNATEGDIFYVDIQQDAVGGRTVTWFSSIKWPAGTTPTLSTGASKKDRFVFENMGSTNYDGFIAGQNL